ncbi:hypothetical protein EG328_008664 [Venturia inaequalis]|uniref:SMP domain-containing protein n=1 Tax=Venturia inaequalis TaxID=5025 RepID=A0A8H3ZCV3_VENIN|nr:hypothetical protein EG328_008664 [Venturia inaequalis]
MSSKNQGQGKSGNEMTKETASKIQSTQDKSGGDMTSGGFAARAQGAADRNAKNNAGTNAQSGGAKK